MLVDAVVIAVAVVDFVDVVGVCVCVCVCVCRRTLHTPSGRYGPHEVGGERDGRYDALF